MLRRASAAAALAGACLVVPSALIGCGGSGLQVRGPAPDSSASTLTEITGCSGRSEHAPNRLTIRCSAPRAVLQNLQWKNWGRPTSTAVGTIVTGTCAPGATTCGEVAKVTASDLVLGSRAAQYKALRVQTGTGKHRVTTEYDVDDRGPTTRPTTPTTPAVTTPGSSQ